MWYAVYGMRYAACGMRYVGERCGVIQARSGKVAFPRTKVVPAMPARAGVEGAAARRAERTAVVRRSVEFMIVALQLKYVCSQSR